MMGIILSLLPQTNIHSNILKYLQYSITFPPIVQNIFSKQIFANFSSTTFLETTQVFLCSPKFL